MSEAGFLGRGWRFPIRPDATGGLGYVEGDANIEQSLKLLLMTALGERVMRPGFGCEAPRLVFAPGSVQYLRLLETSVREAVRDWEPRVDLEDVVAEVVPGDQNRVNVNIDYRIRSSNTRSNLVFPFYLGQLELET
ncbi:MAG: GPW/gp25 family protein [Xanthomonadales bacterium]|nr:GPW/gp25 family protein [Xanthomonadales bacterium]